MGRSKPGLNFTVSLILTMSKLCLLVLGVLSIAALAAAWDHQEDTSLSEDLANSRLVRSPAAAAKRERKNKPKGSGGKLKKGRKSKSGKRSSRRKTRRGERKSRKSKRKGGKSKKGSKSSRRTKSGSGRTVSDTCLEKSITIMRMWKDVISNFEKQKKRMEKQNGTGASKSSKKGAFAPIGLRLISVGGGNKSALSCGGKTNNAGAKQLKNLTDILSSRATNIHKMCGNFSKPNMTKLSTCSKLSESFKKGAQKCLDMSIGATKTNTTAACACWNGAELNKTVQAAKDCKFSTEAKTIANQLKNCTKAFGKCRKYEDAAITAITACNSNSNSLTLKVATLTKNAEALAKAQKTVKALAASRRQRTSTAATSCVEVISLSTKLAVMVIQFPSSPQIIVTATKISASSTVSCSAAEKTSLKGLETKLKEAADTLQTAIDAAQAQLQTLTGSTASSAAIAAATTTSKVSTSKPSGRREMMIKYLQQTA